MLPSLSFTENWILGDPVQHRTNLQAKNQSLMLMKALSSWIGYGKASKIARTIHTQEKGSTLKEMAVNLAASCQSSLKRG